MIRWRKSLGFTRTNSEGNQRLIRAASEGEAERIRGRPPTPKQLESRRRTARELDLGRNLHNGYYGPWWTKAEVRLLGRLPDDEVARRIGRSVDAVRQKWQELARARRPSCK